MAELTVLEDKIGEVIGLAQASQKATDRVIGLVDDTSVKQILKKMHDDAAQIEERGTELAGSYDGKKTAILEKASETKAEASEMMQAYLGSDADGLDGLEFLTMAEAGEVGHWKIVDTLNKQAGDETLQELRAAPRGHAERLVGTRARGRSELAGGSVGSDVGLVA
jgi:hypothetical protein